MDDNDDKQQDAGGVSFAKYLADPRVKGLRDRALVALSAIREGKHWADWRTVSDYLAEGRREAMAEAGNVGGNADDYRTRKAFGRWLDENAEFRALDNATRAHCLWYVDHRDQVEAWRDGLDPAKRMQMNHPSVVKRNYEKAHPPLREEDEDEDAERRGKRQSKDEQMAALRDELAKLRAELATERTAHETTKRHLTDVMRKPLLYWQSDASEAVIRLKHENPGRAERFADAFRVAYPAQPVTLAVERPVIRKAKRKAAKKDTGA
jgi:hypothetical protein